MTPEEEIKALRTALADLLDCTELNMDSMEPETLEAIERANVLLGGPAPARDVSQTNCEYCGDPLPCPNGCAYLYKKALPEGE